MGPFFVGCGVRGGNKEVIHIDDEPSFCDHVMEQVIHESLEYGRRATKTKEHDCWFEESFVSNKGCLPLVTIFDADIVVSPMNVKFSKVVSIL